ncbi:hypothetical protein AB3B53_003194 [Salmonella enterica]
MKKIIIPLLGLFVITNAGYTFAVNKNRLWDSDVVEDYLNKNKGATISSPVLTNPNADSRWYGTFRVKGSYMNENKLHQEALELGARLRGKTYIADKIGIIGDFWFKGTETYARDHGETIKPFDDLDDKTKWEQYRFGIERDDLGAFMYGKHTATWSFFTMDMGAQGLLDTQGDAGGKNAGKFLYKKQFDNNLFLAASYDHKSKIAGMDIGYQTADLYSFRPNDYGFYLSGHNGQPMVMVGNKAIIGNVDIDATHRGDNDNADTDYARNDTGLITWAASGYANIGSDYRVVGQMAWSDMDDSDTREKIKERGWAKKGVGYSANLGIQVIPKGYKGFSYILYNSWDQIGYTSITPQIEYWFGNGLRAWVSYTWEEVSDDITRIEFQWDF